MGETRTNIGEQCVLEKISFAGLYSKSNSYSGKLEKDREWSLVLGNLGPIVFENSFNSSRLVDNIHEPFVPPILQNTRKETQKVPCAIWSDKVKAVLTSERQRTGAPTEISTSGSVNSFEESCSLKSASPAFTQFLKRGAAKTKGLRCIGNLACQAGHPDATIDQTAPSAVIHMFV